jgi:thiaminase/transcriptional activator TenA
MTLSQKIWQQIQPVYQAILAHPFNQELMQGTLAAEIFAYYIEQDALYLRDYARVLATIAARSTQASHRGSFLKFTKETLMAEQELVHQFFRDTLAPIAAIKPTIATVAYTSYLLNVAVTEPYEVVVAAVLPCFWIYHQLGLYSAANTIVDNPYARWIDAYSRPEFSASVAEAIAIFDQLAEQATEVMQQKMCEAFYKSSLLEWHFWHDAYTKRQLEEVVFATLHQKVDTVPVCNKDALAR